MNQYRKIFDNYIKKEKNIIERYNNKFFIINEKFINISETNLFNKKFKEEEKKEYLKFLMKDEIYINARHFSNEIIKKEKAFFIISQLIFTTFNTLVMVSFSEKPCIEKYLVIFLIFILFHLEIKSRLN